MTWVSYERHVSRMEVGFESEGSRKRRKRCEKGRFLEAGEVRERNSGCVEVERRLIPADKGGRSDSGEAAVF